MSITEMVSQHHNDLAIALAPYRGKTLSTKEIKTAFAEKWGAENVALKKKQIQPWDHCNNNPIEKPCRCSMTEMALLEKRGDDQYLVLGSPSTH